MNASNHDASSEPERNSDIEREILETELALKQSEIKLRQRDLRRRSGVLSRMNVSAAEATIVVGLLAFLGSFFATYFQESSKLALKKQEQESALILNAMKGTDARQNLNRLRLLIDAGFIQDDNGKIKNVILSGKYGDDLLAPSSPSLLDAIVEGSAPRILREILRIADRIPDIDIIEKDDYASIVSVAKRDGRIVLLYDRKRLEDFDTDKSNKWAIAAVLGHELGHVVLGHLDTMTKLFAKPGLSIRAIELEAERYAGFVLRQLGASLEQSKNALAFLPEQSSPTHPSRSERIEVLVEGWKGN